MKVSNGFTDEHRRAMVLRLPSGTPRLPDTEQWINRFEIRSETSDRIYIVSQHRTKRHWGCSCPGWRTGRRCKHIGVLGLPAGEQPHEVNLVS